MLCPYRTKGVLECTLKRTVTRAEPRSQSESVPQQTTSRCGPERAMQRQTVLYYCTLMKVLNANPYPAPSVCNVSQPGVGCKVYQMGTSEVHFGTLFTKRCEHSQSEPPCASMQWSNTARYGSSLPKELECSHRVNQQLEEMHSLFPLSSGDCIVITITSIFIY